MNDLKQGNKKALQVSIVNDEVTFKCSAISGDLKITMKKKGPNNLFDFYEFSKDDGILLTNPTDYLMAIKLRVENDADGDNINSRFFTGGNHDYNNRMSGTKTATIDNLRFRVDGEEVSSFNGCCDQLVVEFDALVNAYNTTKEDGTGRNAMKIHYTLVIKSECVDFEIDLEALEDVVIERYNGVGFYLPDSTIQFVGGKSGKYPITDMVNSESLSTTEIIGETDRLQIRCRIEKEGLGMFTNNEFPYSAFSTRDNKAYFMLISRDTALAKDEHCYLRGSYSFKAF